MPTDLPRAAGFLLGFWLALVLVAPIGYPRASTAEAPPGAALAALEAQLHDGVNAARERHYRVRLRPEPALSRAARSHSADMAARRYLSHENPEGENPMDRIQRAGARGFNLAAENVGMTSRVDPNREILEGWLASPVHRKNLLGPAFNATGIGIARAADGTLYYTQLYANYPR